MPPTHSPNLLVYNVYNVCVAPVRAAGIVVNQGEEITLPVSDRPAELCPSLISVITPLQRLN